MVPVTITTGMASTRVESFLRAKQCLRTHRDWSDEQVAEFCGIPLAMIDLVIFPARKEVEQEGEVPGGPSLVHRGPQ